MEEFYQDGILLNAMLGVGMAQDVEAHNRPGVECLLSDSELEDLFWSDELCQRVCGLIPDRAAGAKVSVDREQEAIADWLVAQDAADKFRKASTMANIYNRGAGIVLAIDDGRHWSQPVDLGDKLVEVKLLDAKSGVDLYPVWTGKTQPSYFQLNTWTSEDSGPQSSETIHPDRILWFPGVWVPDRLAQRKAGTPSRLANFWKSYSRYELAQSVAVNLMARISIVTLKQRGITKMLQSDNRREAEGNLQNRLRVLKGMVTSGILLLDMDDAEADVVSRSLSEVANILDRAERLMVAASGLSKLDLFGSAEGGGLANDDLRDRQLRASKVADLVNGFWRSNLQKALKPQFGPIEVEYESTLEYSRKEELDFATGHSQILMGAMDRGVIQPNELRDYINSLPAFSGRFAE